MRGRGGACPARGFATITTLQVNCTNGFPLWGKLSPQVTDEGESSGHFPLIRRVPRHLPPKGKAFSVGAGYAPPATVYYNEYNGLVVGAAYMPPVAAVRSMRYNGKIARNGQDRSLQTCRKSAFCQLLLTFLLFVGRGLDPSLLFCGNAKLTGKLQLWLPPLGEAVTAGD